MIRRLIPLIVIFAALGVMSCHRTDPRRLPRVTQASLHYQGAFKMPKLDYTQPGGDLSGCCKSIGFDPVQHGLFVSMNEGENKYNGWLAEVSIPTPAIAQCVTVSSTCSGSELPSATILQAPHDAWNPNLQPPSCGNSSSGCVARGLLVDGETLYGAAYINYDAGYLGMKSLFSRSRNLSTPGIVGPMEIAAFGSNNATNGGVTGGFLTAVPDAWQALLGGNTLAANWGISINSRASWGTPAVLFNRSPSATTQPAQALAFYFGIEPDRPTLGQPMQPNVQWNDTGVAGGAVFIAGSSTVLYIGQHTNAPCYGVATQDPTLVGTPTPDGGDIYCLDYEVMGKGQHGHPWTQRAWAYDANDLAAVKSGAHDRSTPVPVAFWDFNFPQFQFSHWIKSTAYDPATQTLYLASQYGDAQGCCYNAPIIHVYKVTPGEGGGGETPPDPPQPHPCELAITNLVWPSRSGDTSGSWSTNQPLISGTFGWALNGRQTFTATSVAGCVHTVTK